MSNTSPLGLFVDAVYVETRRLLEELADLIARERGPALLDLAPNTRVLLIRESGRMTQELMHLMAWLLMEKAVATDEIAEHDAAQLERYRLRPLDVSHAPLADLTDLPIAVRGLIDRCRRVHARALEVERLIREHRNAIRDSTAS